MRISCVLAGYAGRTCVYSGEKKKRRGLAPDSLLFWLSWKKKKKTQKKYNWKHSILTSAQYNMLRPKPSVFSVARLDLLTSCLFHCSSTPDWKGSPMTGQNTFNHWLNSGRVVLRECQSRSKCKNNPLLKKRLPTSSQAPPPVTAPTRSPLHPPTLQLPADFSTDVLFSSMLPSHDLYFIKKNKKLKPQFKPSQWPSPIPATDQSQQQSSNIPSCSTAQ